MGWARVAGVIVAVWTTSAGAQILPWPGEPGAPGGPAGPSGAQQTVCAIEMRQLGQAVEQLRAAAKSVDERKANSAKELKAKRDEVCRYLTNMAQAAANLMRYVAANGAACGLNEAALARIRDGGQRDVGICRQVCIVDPSAGRLDDVPPQFVTPMRLANSNCGDP
jgi:hypothetical protein